MTTLTQPQPEIERDRYSRPLVKPPGGGKAVAYTRCTTFVGCLEDTYNLSRWQQRMVALGLSQRPDLMLGVTATDPDDKKALNRFCEDAMEAAKAHAAATTGTALHALTERIDRGQEVGAVPDAYLADLAAYTEATKDLTATHIEQFCVLDSLKIGGTPDRVVRYQGKRYIADVKTGSIEYGVHKIAMQLAVYARSHTYDVATGVRGEHGAEMDRGLIIHLPAGAGTCELVWVDLLAGWEGVKLAKRVREVRALKFRDLTQPFHGIPADEAEAAPEPDVPADIPALISKCVTADQVRSLWALHADAWTEGLTALAADHIASLKAAS